MRAVLNIAYYLVPNLKNFNFIAQASHGEVVEAARAVWAILYAVVYISILLSASVLIFQRRNFK